MIDVMLAVLAAVFYSLGVILVRKGLVESNFISASFVITIVGNIILWGPALLLATSNRINPTGVLLFALAGILDPGLTRLSYFFGMERIGASISASIFAVNPVFGTMAAVVLLGEQPTIGTLVGTSCVVCGALLLGKSIHTNNAKSGKVKTGLAVSVFGSIVVGMAFIVRKMALNMMNKPIIGVALGYAMALSIYTIVVAVSSNMRSIASVDGHTFRLFWKAGVFMSLGWITSFYAIMYGNVVTVNPIMDTEPLFIFFFAYLYLRELETITPKLVIGTIIVILGVTLVSVI